VVKVEKRISLFPRANPSFYQRRTSLKATLGDCVGWPNKEKGLQAGDHSPITHPSLDGNSKKQQKDPASGGEEV
jgi:hypothetical protein